MSAAGSAPAGGGRGRPVPGDRSRPPRPHALRRYGQNHLVDKNILHAIVDQAAVGPDDVVLEVGAAGGLLTRPVLERARLVHAFEIDRRWLPRLEELAAAEPRFALHAGDALKADLTALDPPPTAVVANLAYNIAIPLIMTTIAGLPSVRRWAVMVQRELGERLFATPSTKAYSAVSVLTQLACRLEKARPVSASAFRPRPRVESSFVTFVRRDAAGDGDRGAPDAVAAAPGPGEYAAVSHLVRLAFGQRRKTLVNSLGGAAHAHATLSRDDVRAALRGLGLSEAARPEELSPPQWLTFARTAGRA
jgi:16S rRNA (adenine1518-N6/adenine1519-N6)-dimethyltransferase